MNNFKKVKRPKSQSFSKSQSYGNLQSPKYVAKCHNINTENINLNRFKSPFYNLEKYSMKFNNE